jgi:hypothetical protein
LQPASISTITNVMKVPQNHLIDIGDPSRNFDSSQNAFIGENVLARHLLPVQLKTGIAEPLS